MSASRPFRKGSGDCDKVLDKKTITHRKCVKEWKLKHPDLVKLHRKQEYPNIKDRLKNEYEFKKECARMANILL
jgi:hypothetical protein